jgi:hypothetical protein
MVRGTIMSEHYDHGTGEILDIGLHGPLLGSTETAELWAALCQAQSAIEPPKRTKEATVKGETTGGKAYEYKYKYAPLDEIINVIRKPLAEAGLGFHQSIVSKGAQYIIRTVIFHKSGQWNVIDYPIFYDARKGFQGFNSGVTTARRYSISLLLGLAPEDDDDANVADARPATIASKAPAARPTPSRAGPRAAPSAQPASSATGDPQEPARAAYRQLQVDIDAAGKHSAEAVGLVYDAASNEWGKPFQPDAKIVSDHSSEGIKTLKERVAYWVKKHAEAAVVTEADAGTALTGKLGPQETRLPEIGR